MQLRSSPFIISVFLLLIVFLLAGCTPPSESYVESATNYCQKKKLANQYIVHWKDKKVSLVATEDLSEWIKVRKEHVEFVEPNYLIEHEPQSPEIQIQTASVFDVRREIEISYAWNKGIWGQGIVVAVVDSGVHLDHPLLRKNIAVNEGEYGAARANNLLDDDGNGYADDVYGWNFVTNSPHIFDESGHGTSMAGVITGMFGNDASLALAPGAKILPVDFMDGVYGTEYHARQALSYALERKANIINNSWSINCSEYLRQSFLEWQNQNVIFVNAAGNNPVDVFDYGYIPSSLELPNFINVGSVNLSGRVSPFSGYGKTVRIYAPGENIPVIYPTSGWTDNTLASGTSVSTAIVSGAAAVIWSAYPDLKAKEVVDLITKGAQLHGSPSALNVRKTMRLRPGSVTRNF